MIAFCLLYVLWMTSMVCPSLLFVAVPGTVIYVRHIRRRYVELRRAETRRGSRKQAPKAVGTGRVSR
jgi:hypothetical protein